MSKIIDMLRPIEAQRAMQKGISVHQSHSEYSKVNVILVGSLIAVSILLAVTVVNAVIIVRVSEAERQAVLNKLDRIEGKLSMYSLSSSSLQDSLEQVHYDINRTRADLKDVTEEVKSQEFALESLSKAKNTLFTRVTELESEVKEK